MSDEDIYKQLKEFQSSFELTGYITAERRSDKERRLVSKLFRAYGLYNIILSSIKNFSKLFQSSFELMGYITPYIDNYAMTGMRSFKALSSLWVI